MSSRANPNWAFDDPPNVAVLTTWLVLKGAWIALVTHDEEDGCWQFHHFGSEADEKEAAVVALSEIAALDPTIEQLADLPFGWRAWRERKDAPWIRAAKEA